MYARRSATMDTSWKTPTTHGRSPRHSRPDGRSGRAGGVRTATGDDVHLMVDANNAWTKPTALEAGREFERLGVHWFEEPVATDDRAGRAALAASLRGAPAGSCAPPGPAGGARGAALSVPIAGYETRTGLAGFRDLIAERAVDVVQPDVIWSGGITACRRIAALAPAANLPCVPHVCSTAVRL